MDGELLQHVRLLGVKVEPHLGEPLEAAGVADIASEEHASGVPLVDQLCDLDNGGQDREDIGQERGWEGRKKMNS